MFRDEQANRIEAVSNATEGQRIANANAIDDCSGEESDNGESTIECDVLQRV